MKLITVFSSMLHVGLSTIYVYQDKGSLKLTLYSRLRCKTRTFLVTAHSILFPLIISLMATIRQPRQNINLVTEAFYDSLSSDKSHNSCITFPYQEQCYFNCVIISTRMQTSHSSPQVFSPCISFAVLV